MTLHAYTIGSATARTRPGFIDPGRLLRLIVVFLAVGTQASAEEAEAPSTQALKALSLEELFNVNVTSVAKKPEPLSKTAAAIHVVTAEELSHLGAPSIPEALRYIPGVEVARVDARSYAISARGFNGTVANKLLVMIDGRSVYTPLYSGVFWDVQDTFIDDVERIEVVRGPGAAVWGANAVNGVVNILTKDAASTQGLLVSGGGGNFERGLVGVRYGGTLGAHGFFRAYGKFFDRGPSLSSSGSQAGDDSRMGQGGFRADWTPSAAGALTVQGDLYGSSIDRPGVSATDLSGGNALAHWTRAYVAGSDLEIQAYYDRTDRDQPSVFGETLDTYDFTLQHHFGLARRHDLMWGLGYRLTRDDVRNSSAIAFVPPRLTQQLFTGFVQDEIAVVSDRLELTLGSKIEHNDYTHFEYQPGVRLAWTPAPTQTLWAAASRAVRAPSRIDHDLFVPNTPPYLLAGGTNFRSEIVKAFELGYKGQPKPSMSTSVSTFYNLYDDLRSLEPGTPIVLANGLEGSGYGVEGEQSWQVSNRWRLSGGYTFFRLVLRRKPGSNDIGQINQQGDSPRHQAFVRSSTALPRRWNLDAALRFVGRLPNQGVPAALACDGRIAWQATQAVEIALVGQNVFDDRHAEFGTLPTRHEVGRSLYGKATCRF